MSVECARCDGVHASCERIGCILMLTEVSDDGEVICRIEVAVRVDTVSNVTVGGSDFRGL